MWRQFTGCHMSSASASPVQSSLGFPEVCSSCFPKPPPPDSCCLPSRLLMVKSNSKISNLSDMKKMIAVLVFLILMQETVSAAWSVTFENPNACALNGSSVEFRCSYNYSDGETVNKTAWYKGELKDGRWTRVPLSDLPSYQNRSEYLGDLQHNCSLAIHDVQENDTGYYYFRFDTETYGWRSKKSVYLSVTDLSARVHPDSVRVGDNVTLECGTCYDQPSAVWFKDGRPVAKPEFQAQIEDTGSYVCAVEGVLSDPVVLDVQYPPVNVSVEVLPGHLTVSGVNLTCSCDANPAADNYTWYRGTVSSLTSVAQVGSGHMLHIPSVEVSHAGLYFCQVSNRLGQNNSTAVRLTMDEAEIDHLILLVGIGIKVFVVLLLTLVIILVWSKRPGFAVHKEENSNDYENIPTA
uniref:B-cell receptor CD22-like isoform X2 n=1 Tax=Scatophagus argus TaxID=75038 RepID=UPI001ED7FD6F|nr:B-cell receptor CD22-like isoform X2 [Scatophagus argus]